MKSISLALAMSLLLVTGACSNDAEKASATSAAVQSAESNLTPEQLGELGAAIKKSPNEAQRLLSERGLTEDAFEKAIRKVSENPEASKQYTLAFKRAGS